MTHIIHRIGFRAKIENVYRALSTINGLSHWWTRDTSGDSTVGGNLLFRFQSPTGELVGAMRMRVTELKPNESVQWKCLEGPPDWAGTNFTFDLKTEGECTILNFGHRNWQVSNEGTAHCSMKWAVFLLSLKDYIEKGQGHPSPNDLKIDNWN